ncbi:MAG: sugar isomerase [Bacteroidetes bacterium]|jgi:glucosamine--fructose-6-phosphate aminotransferase (isomerizing)|nr:sugar isomerase [Bacteroidota bacterium]
MNINNNDYGAYFITNEMIDTKNVMVNFDGASIDELIASLPGYSNFLITGEGSSRLFPGKHIREKLLKEKGINIIVDGGLQSKDYYLDETVIFGLSNSGKTSELIQLLEHRMTKKGNCFTVGISAYDNTPLKGLSNYYYQLTSGEEKAVAATKTVIEQTYILHVIFAKIYQLQLPDHKELGMNIEKTLNQAVDHSIIEKFTQAPLIYFAGRNNGVAEELCLKTNEILRKKSMYLEGTYLLHGVEEVMKPDELIVIVDPFENELEKCKKLLHEDIGIEILVISNKITDFPTIQIPFQEGANEYLQLVAGWNLMIESGINSGINIDKPERVRKIGNEHQTV